MLPTADGNLPLGGMLPNYPRLRLPRTPYRLQLQGRTYHMMRDVRVGEIGLDERVNDALPGPLVYGASACQLLTRLREHLA